MCKVDDPLDGPIRPLLGQACHGSRLIRREKAKLCSRGRYRLMGNDNKSSARQIEQRPIVSNAAISMALFVCVHVNVFTIYVHSHSASSQSNTIRMNAGFKNNQIIIGFVVVKITGDLICFSVRSSSFMRLRIFVHRHRTSLFSSNIPKLPAILFARENIDQVFVEDWHFFTSVIMLSPR